MLPITGPFSKTETAFGAPSYYGYRPKSFYAYRKWYRQKKPHNLPLEYQFVMRRLVSNDNTLWYTNYDVGNDQNPGDLGTLIPALNKAYGKFRSKAYDNASIGVSLAERKQAMGMIATRAIQLYKFTRSLKALRFKQAAKELGIKTAPKGLRARRGSKALASNWLEFHFGWSPLIKDIYDSVDVLQSEFSDEVIRAQSSAALNYTMPKDANGVTRSFNAITKYRIQAKVRVTNPNLALATQLGLTNPAVVAWELVPFSFVVDWFVNVGDVLQSYTDFAGFTLVEPQRTRLTVVNETRTGRPPGTTFNVKLQYVMMDRSPSSPPGPVLRMRDTFLPSPVRAITQIALLTQFLPRK